MIKRKTLAILVAAVTILAVVGMVTAQKAYKLKEKRLVSLPELRQQKRDKEANDATPVQQGVMTNKQRKHSKLFEIAGGKRLEDLPSNSSGDINTEQEVPLKITPRYNGLNDYLKGLACKADAVVIGTVKSKESQLTEQGTYIFTDYELSVENVLKNNAAAMIQPDAGITVTRAGGAVRLKGNGRLLTAASNSERPLKVGRSYILFLKFIPDTGAYSAVAYAGDNSFEIADGKVKQVSDSGLPFGMNNTTTQSSFMSEVQVALNMGCGQ